MRRIEFSVMLWLLLLMGAVTAFSANYRREFGADWDAAVRFVNDNHEQFKKEFEIFGVDSRIAEAVVFPELIRYSLWQDEIEKVAVNGLYITKGKDAADFSIGRFQMKPSFAEEVEEAWNKSPLAQEYGFVFNVQQNSEARRSRVRRLGTMEGQCRYLAIFIRLMQLRHPQLAGMPAKERIRLLATAYNWSFSAPLSQIRRMQKKCRFHTDIIVTRKTKMYCYADIAQACLNALPASSYPNRRQR